MTGLQPVGSTALALLGPQAPESAGSGAPWTPGLHGSTEELMTATQQRSRAAALTLTALCTLLSMTPGY